MTATEVRKADGSLCYSRESFCYCGHACEQSFTSWKDSAGNVVAGGSSGGVPPNLTLRMSLTCNATGEACQVAWDPQARCSDGGAPKLFPVDFATSSCTETNVCP